MTYNVSSGTLSHYTTTTAELAESIKWIQKRALRIICGGNSFTIS